METAMTTKTIIASIIALIAVSVAITPNAFAEKPVLDLSQKNDQSCLEEMQDDTRKKASSQNSELLAKSVARNSPQFANTVKSDNFEIYGVTQTWDMNPETCTVELLSSNVHVKSTDESGKTRIVEIEVDAKTLNVISSKATTEEDLPRHSGLIETPSQAGFTFSGNAAETTEVHSAYMNYDIPTPNDPSQFNCGTTSSTWCYASIWTGLTTDKNDLTPMVQAGTDSICKGNNCGTSRTYRGWMETVPSSGSSTLYYCSSTWESFLTAGDDIVAQVTNGEKYGGTSSTNYEGYVVNVTDNKQCTNGSITGTANPKFSEYVYERPLFTGGPAPLAQITDVTGVYSTMWYGGATVGIDTPYSNGWYTNYEMWTADPDSDPNAIKNADGVKETGSNLKFDWITSEGTD